MATPTVGTNIHQSSQSKKPEKTHSLPLGTRRLAAWAVEITLVVASGLVPFGLGVYANSRSDLNRVPLNPVLVLTERAIARPLALPVSYGIRNVASPTNFLWTVALLAPITLSWWQLYLLGKTGSTIPKRWFGVRVVSDEGTAPGLGAVVVREGLGRWTAPVSIAYLLWRYSFTFPNLGLFTFLAVLMVLGEGMGWPSQKRRRAFHDQLAGTYTVDATDSKKRVKPPVDNTSEQPQPENQHDLNTSSHQSTSTNAIRRSPNLILFLVGITSMIAVLSTLVGTQIYIQSQESLRKTQQINSQKFLELVKQLSPDSGVTNEERQRAILILGGINDTQSIKFLVDLLVEETDPKTIDTIQQALANIGPSAMPELKRMNQFLASEMESVATFREIRQKQLNLNQQAINKILTVYSGKINGMDLSSTKLGSKNFEANSLFNLELDNTDLSGVIFKSANLNQASLKGTRFRSVGEDGRWDTYDDVTADLSNTHFQQADLSNANLSRVLMNRSDFSRATLNKANLSNSRLVSANLSSAQLIGSDLQKTILEDATLTGADISDAKLMEANLYAAHLGRVSAIGTQLSYADLTNTDWQGADLSEAYLDNANLTNANLSAARLSGAVLRSTNMTNANLRNADLSRADLRGANLKEADFQGTILFTAKQDTTDQFVQTSDLGSQAAVVQEVDFTEVKNLDAKQLAFICTKGGIHPRCP
ncbi:pentapeptide repeat-containing protein [Anabaena cylindrica FACHB-243]|uniref:RDD domain containing protein n=1 Tax=Anabaena cylindrica (strain ATCC 27899 / PCC 7122) TaxID=272123 RepID=K9ZLN9_ANACC|nr:MULTISPECIES: pentapeptide repeat-containing protein [Anabaena]AFZ60111.1 RDD domain containing protein [Anabaena cylindrica PCC 7122]MBD2417833.1 pentapeptide repeat-containing protein [Anabaena cylindrica FACHB-243]MBY5283746.1 low-complexity protein [Anabaena sp. CCAP 1446/1C]MBY5307974.1 low-complexity protein [Anabaena sp. CCAP 1446/1C]MCM2404748.1 pentapeptide repeat-containing protein [Anabaena sp. CCAP 1446/1C]